jgi:hypothetical protein
MENTELTEGKETIDFVCFGLRGIHVLLAKQS